MYQSFYALLHKSASPKYMVSSTVSGSNGLLDQMAAVPQLTYGLSKAAVNNLTRRIHFEDKDITAVPFHPGWVQTDMGNGGAKALGMEEAPMKYEVSIAKLVQLFDTATRDSHGGKYWSVDGDKELPW
ncbi:hypothetical protein MMC34_008228 [Xylographa carneopallida]|nr:hypothetical protein [Xylographa carneopallida]